MNEILVYEASIFLLGNHGGVISLPENAERRAVHAAPTADAAPAEEKVKNSRKEEAWRRKR